MCSVRSGSRSFSGTMWVNSSGKSRRTTPPSTPPENDGRTFVEKTCSAVGTKSVAERYTSRAGTGSPVIRRLNTSVLTARSGSSSAAFKTLPISRHVYFSSLNLPGGTLATASGFGSERSSLRKVLLPVAPSSEKVTIAFGFRSRVPHPSAVQPAISPRRLILSAASASPTTASRRYLARRLHSQAAGFSAGANGHANQAFEHIRPHRPIGQLVGSVISRHVYFSSLNLPGGTLATASRFGSERSSLRKVLLPVAP